MIAQESAARGQAGCGNCRHPAAIQRNVGRQSGRDGSEIVISKILERDRAGRNDRRPGPCS